MHSLLCLLHFLLCLFHLQQFKPQTSVAVAAVCYFPDERPADSPPQQTISTYLVCLACFFFVLESGTQRESAREEEQSQGAAGPAQELKDAGAPRLRVMSGSNWEKERDRICERHMALFRRIEALECREKETGQLKRTIQHSAK